MAEHLTREQIADGTEAGRRLVRALPPATTEAERERRRRFLRELDAQACAMLKALDLAEPDGPDLVTLDAEAGT